MQREEHVFGVAMEDDETEEIQEEEPPHVSESIFAAQQEKEEAETHKKRQFCGMLNQDGEWSDSDLCWEDEYESEWSDSETILPMSSPGASRTSSSSSSSSSSSDDRMATADDDVMTDDEKVDPDQWPTDIVEASDSITCKLCFYSNPVQFQRCSACNTPLLIIFGTMRRSHVEGIPQFEQIGRRMQVASTARADYDISDFDKELERMRNGIKRIKYACADVDNIDIVDLRFQCHRLARTSTLCKDIHTQIKKLDKHKLIILRRSLLQSGLNADIYPEDGLNPSLPADILIRVLQFISPQSLLTSVVLVNRKFSQLTRDQKCWQSVELYLSMAKKFQDDVLKRMAERWKKIESFRICDSDMTSNGFETLAKNCTDVQNLAIIRCKKIRFDTKFQVDLKKFQFLTHLDLTENPHLEIKHLKMIVKTCPQVIYLNLTECIAVSPVDTLKMLIACKKRLKYLNLYNARSSVAGYSDMTESEFWDDIEYLNLNAFSRSMGFGTIQTANEEQVNFLINGIAKAKKLKFLSLGSTIPLSDAHLKILTGVYVATGDEVYSQAGEGCSNMVHFHSTNAKSVTKVGIDYIEKGWQKMKAFDMRNCKVSRNNPLQKSENVIQSNEFLENLYKHKLSKRSMYVRKHPERRSVFNH